MNRRAKLFLWWGLCIGVVPFAGDALVAMRNPDWDAARADAATHQGKPYDRRPPLERFLDLRKTNADAMPLVSPATIAPTPIDVEGKKVQPLGGVSNAETLQCNENGEYSIFDADEHGFENPKGLYRPEPEVVFIGGSQAQGSCVPLAETIAARVRARYPSTLNLSYGDDGPLIELATLKEYAAPLRPKRVLWFLDRTDQWDLLAERKIELLTKYMEPDFTQGLSSIQPGIDAGIRALAQRRLDAAIARGAMFETEHRSLAARAADYVLLRHLRRMFAAARSAGQDDYMLAVMAEAKRVVSGWGGRLWIVYVPTWDEVRSSMKRPEHGSYVTLSAKAGIPLIDLDPVVRGQKDPLALYPFGLRGHLNPRGNEIVADVLLQQIP